MSIRVIVGSKNPVKINAVKFAFEAVWPEEDFEIDGFEVSSGVSEQPMSDKEALTGAKNRATAVLNETDADYGVGLEGGLQEFEGRWYATGWVAVMNRNGVVGTGSTIRIEIPPEAIHLLASSNDLGEATDKLFERTNVKQQEGIFGILTNNTLTRTSAFKDGIASALARFNFPELYQDAKTTSAEELVDVVDEINNVLYSVKKKEAHEKGLLHRTVIGMIHTSDGRICLVKQASDRQDAGQFVCPIGGHIRSGESEEDALLREAEEEIGTSEIKHKLLGRKIFNREVIGRKENHYFIVHQVTYEGPITLNHEAVDYEYFTPEQLAVELEYNPKKFGNAFKFVYQNFYNN